MRAQKRPVLIAPDKFRGTLTAAAVTAAVARGLERVGLASDACAIADGGEGTLETLAAAGDAEIVPCASVDALGRPLEARFARLDERTALVESADAIGLELIGAEDRDAVAASSAGVGELIAAAAADGAKHVLVAVGGTASTDGGAGAVEVLREHRLVGLHGPLKRCPKVTVLCDVRSAWEQASLVFAAQKGADEAQRELLGRRMDELAEQLPRDPRGVVMSGAGGGLSGGLWAVCNAELRSGAAWVLDHTGFNERMLAARAVITGEGSLDRQTLLGKAVGEVATRARQAGVPCHAIVGRAGLSGFDARILDFESVVEAGDEAAISDAAERLVDVLPGH